MEIKRKDLGRVLELQLDGRLDAYWADHLDQEITSVIREGRHRICLNMASLSYMSSAGIRILVKFRKQLKALDGFLAVTEPSEPIVKIMKVTRLEALFQVPAEAHEPAPDRSVGGTWISDTPHVRWEVISTGPNAMGCRVVGEPNPGSWVKDCLPLSLPRNGMAIGIGAIGSGYDDCRDRFGELMAVAGAVAYQPTDRRNVPDYLTTREDVLAGMQVIHCLGCEGGFSHQVNFDSKPDQAASLLDIVTASLDILKAPAAAIVMAAEVRGLVGAALKRSPALEGAGYEPFQHPDIQNRMTFTAEPAYARSVALVAGVALTREHKDILPLVRPLSADEWPRGHFHAAAFSYRPLPGGRVDLSETVRALFEEEVLNGILHLVNDTRPIAGVGQSEFVRGICWISPIQSGKGGAQ